ncbi:MAG: Flp pilus assembly complex ATPase component TadA, partial [Lachnospiraceae bacterium]|nr:Flp pilus assembly complex ATPase component TadA [Lachnospiraceae bacterium]
MRVIDIDNIVGNMRDQNAFVFRCEEVFHDKISSACATIVNSKKTTILLSGPSGSGKTTTANRIRSYLENLGIPVIMLSMDNFLYPLEERPPELDDWESPLCVNFEKLTECLHSLKEGKLTDMPVYDFHHGTVGGYQQIQGDRNAYVVIEGIHALNPMMYD